MAKPPVFDRYTHERQKDLLKAEQDRLDSVEGWKTMGMFGLLIAVGVVMVLALISLLGSWFR